MCAVAPRKHCSHTPLAERRLRVRACVRACAPPIQHAMAAATRQEKSEERVRDCHISPPSLDDGVVPASDEERLATPRIYMLGPAARLSRSVTHSAGHLDSIARALLQASGVCIGCLVQGYARVRAGGACSSVLPMMDKSAERGDKAVTRRWWRGGEAASGWRGCVVIDDVRDAGAPTISPLPCEGVCKLTPRIGCGYTMSTLQARTVVSRAICRSRCTLL